MSEAPKDPQRTYNDASVLKAIKDYGDEMMANEVYPTKDKYRDGRTYKELATMTKEQWDSFLVARGAPDAEKPRHGKDRQSGRSGERTPAAHSTQPGCSNSVG